MWCGCAALVEQCASSSECVVAVWVADEFVLLQEREGLLPVGRVDPQAQLFEGVLPGWIRALRAATICSLHSCL